MRSTLIAVAVATGLVSSTTAATAAVNPEPPAVIETGANEYQLFFVSNGKVIQRAKSGTGAYRDTVVAGSTGFAQLPVAVVGHPGTRVSLAAVKSGRVPQQAGRLDRRVLALGTGRRESLRQRRHDRKFLNGDAGIFFTDQLGATHLCGLDALGNDTGCQVLR